MYKKSFTDKIELEGILGAARDIVKRNFGEELSKTNARDLFIYSSDPSVIIYIPAMEPESKRRCYVFGDKREVERLELIAKKFRFNQNP